ncbi:MAG TPA: hypothetical protein VJU14_06975 [Solirubrobacterales bacterium]|nr:hypothetical protein [Solirubrobacterales bacterium]
MTPSRLIPLLEPSEWEGALEGIPHVFGHTWGSCRALGLDGGGEPALYVAEGEGEKVACPLVERPIEGRRDVATPYGFSGLTGTGPWPGFTAEWRRFAGERGYVAGYLAVNALFGDDTYANPETVTVANETFVVDLREGAEGAWGRLSTNRRRQLRGWRAEEYEVDGQALAEFFVEHYPLTMERKEAAARHRFGAATLAALCELPNTFLVGARGDERRLESVSLFGYSPYAGDFIFNAALPGCAHHSVPLIWTALNLLVEKGISWLNLGGGMSPGDSLADFKARFGALRFPMRAVKAVYDPAAYGELCARAGVDADDRDGYFPAYRNV